LRRKIKLTTIIGARPQFVKASVLSSLVRSPEHASSFEERIIHTGQHYDRNMSEIFFSELGIPHPDINLGIGGTSHGRMTGEMLASIERDLSENTPYMVSVYGDTNSTLAGALAAAKMNLRVAHIEAGLRSYDRRMPEEVNRVLTDHLSSLLLCPTVTAAENLRAEGMPGPRSNAQVAVVGDVMLDAALRFEGLALSRPRQSTACGRLGIAGGFALLTLHRAENTDDIERLATIIGTVSAMSGITFVFPVHPRTRKLIEGSGLRIGANIRSIDPVGYLDMIELERECDFVVTDSGGVQKEAYFFKKSCITLRDATEWVETVSARANVLVGADGERIREAILRPPSPSEWPALFGDGNAGELILDEIRKAALP